ncbi:MAG: hypothetical protein AAF602_19665, partial [Myxococcota bacterium]
DVRDRRTGRGHVAGKAGGGAGEHRLGAALDVEQVRWRRPDGSRTLGRGEVAEDASILTGTVQLDDRWSSLSGDWTVDARLSGTAGLGRPWLAPRLAVRRRSPRSAIGVVLARQLGHLTLPALLRVDDQGPSRLDEAGMWFAYQPDDTWRLRLDGAWRRQRGVPTVTGARFDRVVPRLGATTTLKVDRRLSLDVSATRRWWRNPVEDRVFVDDGTLDRFGTRLEGALNLGRRHAGPSLDIGAAWLDRPLGLVVSDPGSRLPPNVPHALLQATAQLVGSVQRLTATAFVRARGLRRLPGGPGRVLALSSGPQAEVLPLASFAGWELSGGVHASF